MGILQWPPREFWQASPYDLIAAMDGWREAYGAKGEGQPSRSKRALARELRQQLELYKRNLLAERKHT
jgi:hypothetical protein